jgi:signal transduction histidine kinase
MPLGRILASFGADATTLSALLEKLPTPIAVFDEHGRPLVHNRRMTEILGPLPPTVQAIPFVGEAGASLAGAASPVARALAGEVATAVAVWPRPATPGGKTPQRLEVSAHPARDAGGAVVGGVLIVGPAPPAAASAPAAAGASAPPSPPAEGESIQREVLGIVGHDLRNPLAAIRMTAQLLGRSDEMAGERRITLANRILTSSTRMDSIVRSLLDYARTRGGAIVRLTREAVDLGALVRRVIEEQEVAFPGRSIRFESAGDLSGQWDPGRIEQIVANLVSNALRHGDDTAPVDVRLDGTAPGEVRLAVHNQGPTISAEELPQLFDAFHIGPRPEGAPRRNIGLGLFIVKELVAAHGGSASARSTDADGTTFAVVLPRTPPPDESAGQ